MNETVYIGTRGICSCAQRSGVMKQEYCDVHGIGAHNQRQSDFMRRWEERADKTIRLVSDIDNQEKRDA